MEESGVDEVAATDVIAGLQRRIGQLATDLAVAEAIITQRNARIAALAAALDEVQSGT